MKFGSKHYHYEWEIRAITRSMARGSGSISLPKRYCDELDLQGGDRVRMKLVGRQIIIEPFDKATNRRPFTGRAKK